MFLLVPRPRPTEGREAIIIPPKILVIAGVVGPTEQWRVHKAFYGFQVSLVRWASYWDQVFQGFQWENGGKRFWLTHISEVNL